MEGRKGSGGNDIIIFRLKHIEYINKIRIALPLFKKTMSSQMALGAYAQFRGTDYFLRKKCN